jgi:hypothetical protein
VAEIEEEEERRQQEQRQKVRERTQVGLGNSNGAAFGTARETSTLQLMQLSSRLVPAVALHVLCPRFSNTIMLLRRALHMC